MKGFCEGLLGQVDIRNQHLCPDMEDYLELRRASIGVYPCLALAELVLFLTRRIHELG